MFLFDAKGIKKYCIWSLVFGIWSLVFGRWYLVVGI
jgi:hypothetical protein